MQLMLIAGDKCTVNSSTVRALQVVVCSLELVVYSEIENRQKGFVQTAVKSDPNLTFLLI